MLQFEWDEVKAEQNRRKHNVTEALRFLIRAVRQGNLLLREQADDPYQSSLKEDLS